MGGQACVFYGAAEFSRDVDLLVLVEESNLRKLRESLNHLQAEPVAVPELDPVHLERGHAVHFRCHHPEAAGLRVDLMSRLRGVDPFEALWERRTSIDVQGEMVDLLALPDLVQAKKTQRDKDWPMIRRLVEQSYFSSGHAGAAVPAAKRSFWLREIRTPELLIPVTQLYPAEAYAIAQARPAVRAALAGDLSAIVRALAEEETEERHQDRLYWQPLKRELEGFRRDRKRGR